VQALDHLAQALRFRGDRRQIVLKLGVALKKVGVFTREPVLVRRVHARLLQPNARKRLGSTITLAVLSAAAMKSEDIAEPETAPRRERSTVSVTAHARRRPS